MPKRLLLLLMQFSAEYQESPEIEKVHIWAICSVVDNEHTLDNCFVLRASVSALIILPLFSV